MKTTNKIIKTLSGAVLSLLVTFGLKQKATSPARILIIGLATLAAASSQAAPGGGGGGGGGGTGGGTIYYLGPTAMTSMNSDGSNKTQVGRFGTPGTATPSTALHNNQRWFIYTCPISGQYYPNGTPRTEVFALRADYDYAISNSNTRVQLTDDITLQPRALTADWVPGDQFVSFKGRRWSSAEPGATVVEGGLYTAALVFGDDGNIIGLAAQPTTPAIVFPFVEPAPGDLWPDLLAYCWDPTGTLVAYSIYADNELWVADLLGARIRIYNNGQAHMPQWSPLGDKIAFTHSGEIWTIKVNGTGAKRIISNTSTWSFNHAYWSSTGSHLVFTGQSVENNQYNQDVFRATATGGTLVNLTSTPATHELVWEATGAWR